MIAPFPPTTVLRHCLTELVSARRAIRQEFPNKRIAMQISVPVWIARGGGLESRK